MNHESQLTITEFREKRAALLEQTAIDPHHLAIQLTELSDSLLRSLYPAPKDTALVALGSYSDYELTPGSDLDVVLIHRPRLNVDQLAQAIWYPLWDLGLKVDNSVRTPKEAITVAVSDPRVLNGLCRPRLIAGDGSLLVEMGEILHRTWNKKRKSLLPEMIWYAKERHTDFGELAYLLEPDLKEAKGGLRDFSVIKALEHLENKDLLGTGLLGIYQAQKTLQEVRVTLHYKNQRASNRLSLQDQDSVAQAMKYQDADILMENVAQAGRTIAFAFDTISRKLLRTIKKAATPKLNISKQFAAHGDEIVLSLPEGTRPNFSMLLRIAMLAASNELHISEQSLEYFVDANLQTPETFSEEDFSNLIAFLACGHSMIPVAESLDHFRLLEIIIPEWEKVRCKPQRNAYHRFTVDRHLLECVANSAEMRRRVRRPDLLLISALLHDIGKGYPGDHTEAGVRIVPSICTRLGMTHKDSEIVVCLIRNHLTLADTATRRDISDPTTIEKVAEYLGDPLVVEILEVLTEADSLATGPSAWSSWKKKLVAELASKTLRALAGYQPEEDPFPGNEFDHLIEQAGDGWAIETDGETMILVAPDRPGLFAQVTGTLALVGAGVLAARVASKDTIAIESFHLHTPEGRSIDWNKFKKELQKSLDDPNGLKLRLQEKAKNYTRARNKAGVKMVPPRVVVAPDASSRATVVEVWAPDRIGLLYDITSIMADMSLSIAHAKVLTLGDDVVDSFYLTDLEGMPISDQQTLVKLSAALTEMFSTGGVPNIKE